MNMHFRYLKHSAIDKEMWDACVKHSPNGLIYAYSWYLDAMSPGWEALVVADYHAVMPVTKKRKGGINYLTQPPFSQQLGIIGRPELIERITEDMVRYLRQKFKFVEINFNFLNVVPGSIQRCNLVLDLDAPFEQIETTFRKDLIIKAKKAGLMVETSENFEEIIHAFKKNYGKKVPNLRDRDFENFAGICSFLQKRQKLLIRKVYSKERSVLTNALFFMDEKRIYYIMSATTPEGRKCDANAFLLFEVIREFAGRKFTFDFEGSSIPSIRNFFMKFGAVEQSYPTLKINNLPGILKLIK